METLFGLFVALVIAILVGQDASKRGMNGILWGIGVFLLLIIFLPIYFIVRKPKLETVNENTQRSADIDKAPKQIQNQADTKIEKNELVLLQELREKGVLSIEEYNNKIKEIDFNSKLQKQIEPIINTLTESKNKGLLSEAEFTEKKNKIIETQTRVIKEWDNRKPKLSDINIEILDGLKEHHKYQLQEKLNLMGQLDFAQNNVIVLNDNKIKHIPLERWERIVEQGYTDTFKLIYILPK